MNEQPQLRGKYLSRKSVDTGDTFNILVSEQESSSRRKIKRADLVSRSIRVERGQRGILERRNGRHSAISAVSGFEKREAKLPLPPYVLDPPLSPPYCPLAARARDSPPYVPPRRYPHPTARSRLARVT